MCAGFVCLYRCRCLRWCLEHFSVILSLIHWSIICKMNPELCATAAIARWLSLGIQYVIGFCHVFNVFQCITFLFYTMLVTTFCILLKCRHNGSIMMMYISASKMNSIILHQFCNMYIKFYLFCVKICQKLGPFTNLKCSFIIINIMN